MHRWLAQAASSACVQCTHQVSTQLQMSCLVADLDRCACVDALKVRCLDANYLNKHLQLQVLFLNTHEQRLPLSVPI